MSKHLNAFEITAVEGTARQAMTHNPQPTTLRGIRRALRKLVYHPSFPGERNLFDMSFEECEQALTLRTQAQP